MLRVKMNPEEKRRAEVLAARSGLNLSAYVRMLLHEKHVAYGKRRMKRVA